MSLETADRMTRLQWFARQMIDVAWQGGDADGGLIQGLAEKAGLISPVEATEENETDWPEPTELGDTYYKFTNDMMDVDWKQLSPD